MRLLSDLHAACAKEIALTHGGGGGGGGGGAASELPSASAPGRARERERERDRERESKGLLGAVVAAAAGPRAGSGSSVGFNGRTAGLAGEPLTLAVNSNCETFAVCLTLRPRVLTNARLQPSFSPRAASTPSSLPRPPPPETRVPVPRPLRPTLRCSTSRRSCPSWRRCVNSLLLMRG